MLQLRMRKQINHAYVCQWRSQRLCQVCEVVIEKVDDRNAERIMRTEIQDRFVIKSPPTDVPVIS